MLTRLHRPGLFCRQDEGTRGKSARNTMTNCVLYRDFSEAKFDMAYWHRLGRLMLHAMYGDDGMHKPSWALVVLQLDGSKLMQVSAAELITDDFEVVDQALERHKRRDDACTQRKGNCPLLCLLIPAFYIDNIEADGQAGVY